jgi:hypothetical protein
MTQIADDHVDGVIREGDMLDFPFQEFGILDAGLALIFAGEGQHLIGHVEAVGFSGGADAPSREEHVDTAAGAEVEHGFSGF